VTGCDRWQLLVTSWKAEIVRADHPRDIRRFVNADGVHPHPANSDRSLQSKPSELPFWMTERWVVSQFEFGLEVAMVKVT
jgi:hypothetical protein